MTRFHREEGQVTVMTALFMIVLVGMAGFVLDVGSWFREQRVAQATVDAAALAGAQALPADPSSANALAISFAAKNGGVAGASISFSSRYAPNDMITVTQAKPTAGLFSQVFGFSTVTVHAHAKAISEVPQAAFGVAPIAVNLAEQDLSGPGCPCFNVPTVLPLGKAGAPGAFGMINLDSSKSGAAGVPVLADWIVNGYDKFLPLGGYFSDPGAKFNSSQIRNALESRYGTELLFPVYDTLSGNGANASYHIVAWAAFHLTLAQAGGNSGSLTGWFTRVIWKGIVGASGPPADVPDLGVHSVALVD